MRNLLSRFDLGFCLDYRLSSWRLVWSDGFWSPLSIVSCFEFHLTYDSWLTT
jgi:hypothetical protein